MHHILLRTLLASAIVTFAGNLAAAPAAPAAPPAATTEAASAQKLRLRWELLRNVFSADQPGGRGLARLTLTNLDNKPLPAQGWGLYFNSLGNVVPGPVGGGLVAEQVGGQLFRLRPASGFAGLAPGATLNIDFYHQWPVIKTEMAPVGPYLVFDSRPETGEAIKDYQVAVMARPEQLDTGDATPLTTAQMLFARNAATADLPAAALPPVFPTPARLDRLPGSLLLASMPRIDAAPALHNEAAVARALLAGHVGAAGAQPSVLRLRVGPVEGQTSPEAYALVIDPGTGISLTGATPAGVFRGLQSLRDLLPLAPKGALELPALRIVDAPRFAYRGFQMDVAHNFQSKETVFRLLDLMARYKLNKLHFHLTDDEGWRVEIAGLPELTAFGATRGHTLRTDTHLQPAYGSGPDVADPHGSGHYSRAAYIAILKYAAARHIEVIPEIEMPGHSRASVKAMESRYRRLARQGKPNASQYLLSDPDDRSVYLSPQMYNDQVLNPGMPGTYAFIERVVADLVAMHKEAGVPMQTIHVGGDELAEGAWEKSPASAALMKKEKLATTADLWDYFYNRVDRILKKHGVFASGWEELGARKVMLDGKPKLIPNPAFTQRGFNVYVWNNLNGAEDLAYRLANAGYATVLAPVTNMYFDMAHNKNPEEPGVHWGAYTELDQVYRFIPFDYLKNSANPARAQGKDRLTDYGKARIRGLEATLFSETVRERDRFDYLVMPRMLALAERAWAPDPAWAREPDAAAAARLYASDWSVFANQLGKRVLPRLDADGAGIAYRIAPPGLTLDHGRVLVNHQLPGFTLRYTSDGSEPRADSPVVSGPIGSKGTIRVAAFADNGRAGRSSQIDNP
ncbi:MAG: family 20 glycosylhydrolase [Massilia sp.]